MSTPRAQSIYEKGATILTLILLVAVGWGPYLYWGLHDPGVLPQYLLMAFALFLLVLGALFDATEELLGSGRGIYAIAVLCSIPAVGVVMTNAALLPVGGLTLMVSAGTWMATRSRGDNRPYFAGMLMFLLFVGGALFPFFTGSLAFIFIAWLAVLQDDKRSRAALTLGSFALAYMCGTVVRANISFAVPMLSEALAPPDESSLETTYMLLPWVLWLLPVLLRLVFVRGSSRSWHRGAAATLLLMLGMGKLNGTSLIVLSAAGAPILSLLCADLIADYFRSTRRSVSWRVHLVPIFVAAIAVGAFAPYCISHASNTQIFPVWQVAAAVILFLGMVITLLRNLSRAVFAILVVSGVLFGSLIFSTHEFIAEPGENVPNDALQAYTPLIGIAVLAVAGWTVFRMLYGRPVPKEVLRSRGRNKDRLLFADQNLRLFTNPSRKTWEGEPASVSPDLERYEVVVFGDIAGAEFPFSSRRGGYFTFRTLTRTIKTGKPAFAISLGDLSTMAAPYPYRRLRTLLRTVPVPLSVAPGNHDSYLDTEYDITLFQSLFGADNSAFHVGAAQFVVLNNADGTIRDEQFAWLDGVFARQVFPYTLVFCHKPLFDPRPNLYYAMDNPDHAKRLQSLFAKYKVTAVLSGHIHSLLAEERDGVTYVISGGGGSKLLESEDRHHYVSVSVSPDVLNIRALPLDGSRKTVSPTPLLDLSFQPRACTSADHAVSHSRPASL